MSISNPRTDEFIQQTVAWARSQDTAVARAEAVMTTMKELSVLTSELAQIRTEAIREMYATGWSMREIGDALGITAARVDQIIKR